ncbi:DUF2971 domain-containing protein [Arthrobacter bambusae]|uniref:DUF2971 domain-containing protein n=1 Tax=Arthrobacter bambusae TaxID=1338426 RepID=UPI00277DC102|nr:DUF2971 domain-containing protein [Arthrobacter bambusae]MDQ0242004.1 hypothetical protein [Arthrobacter bambusae]
MIEDFAGGGSSIFSNRLDADESYLYHYTSADTLAKILESKALRMGPYSETNDPRETSEWSPRITLDSEDDVDGRPEEIARLWLQIRDIRKGVKLGCFTLDAETEQTGWEFPFDRGWARARMWHQYANDHAGACLVFDRAERERSLQTLSVTNAFAWHHGKVVYEDTAFGEFGSRLSFSSTELRAGNSEERLAQIVKEHRSDLFFKKNRDWQSENEYRHSAISNSESEFVPITSSLVGIVLGADFPHTELCVLNDRLHRGGFTGVKGAYLSWRNGMPHLVGDTDSLGRRWLVLPPVGPFDDDGGSKS